MAKLSVPPGISSAEAAFEIDGESQPALTEGLLSLVVAETTAGLYRCEACFGNLSSVGKAPGYRYFDRQILDFG
jgi:hypothetical protein